MSRPHLVEPGQPLLLRVVLSLFEFAASLKLAVALILWLAATLAIGTFVEAAYGTPVAQYGVYQTFWFNLLLVLLAINIFCAAAIRFPWKKYQTGFVITHIGLLTLLFGTALSRMHGIDAQVFINEFGSSNWALEEDMHFDMVVHKDADKDDKQIRLAAAQGGDSIEPLRPIEFKPGPFNWEDYGQLFTLQTPAWKERQGQSDNVFAQVNRYVSGWMFGLARKAHAGDVIYDRDGVRLEVLDYLADSREVLTPQITVAVSTPTQTTFDNNGKPITSLPKWMMNDLNIVRLPKGTEYPYGSSEKGRFPGGGVSFRMTDKPEHLNAFLNGGPTGSLGEKGQVVLTIDGKQHRFLVDEKLGKGKFPIAGTDWQAELAGFWPSARSKYVEEKNRFEVSPNEGATSTNNPAVEILLFKKEKQEGRLVLFADEPGDSIEDHKNNIFGDYWFSHEGKSRDERAGANVGNRIDILQVAHRGEGETKPTYDLYYRRWNKATIAAKGKLPSKGSPATALPAFDMGTPLKFFVHEHLPSDAPLVDTLPIDFARDKTIGQRRPAVKVRLTVDHQPHEFWLEAYRGDPEFTPTREAQHKVVAGNGRKVSITLPMRAIDIGFRVRLLDFERKLDPGTSQPSHYSSTVDFIQLDSDRNIHRASLSGANGEVVKIALPPGGPKVMTAESLAVTADGEWIYWTDSKARSISRAKLNNPKAVAEVVISDATLPTTPLAIAIDSRGEALYWIDYLAGRDQELALVRKATLDGQSIETLARVTGRPTGLAISPQDRKLFFTYRVPSAPREPAKGAVGCVNFDGGELNLKLIDNIDPPSSLAADIDRSWLYWTEPVLGVIRRAKFDGSSLERVAIPDDQKPVSVAVDAEHKRLYWADEANQAEPAQHEQPEEILVRHKLWTAGLEGEEPRVLLENRIDTPRGLLVDAKRGQLWWTQEAMMRHNVWITMNAPVEFSNPQNGHSYRLFQESFVGPFKPGSAEYEEAVPTGADPDDLYASVLSVNYDPGRAVRNIGCLLVVVGIATMFYMRAYFFTPRRRVESPTDAPSGPESEPASVPKREVGAKKKKNKKKKDSPREVVS